LKLTNQCRKLSKERASLAHGQWLAVYARKKPPRLVTELRRYGIPGKQTSFTLKKIKHLTDEIWNTYEELSTFMTNNHPQGAISKRVANTLRALMAGAQAE
jgi:hypothetical protein